MKIIEKFPLRPSGVQKVDMPKDSTILSVQRQGGFISLWALIETDKEAESRFFIIAQTGKELPENLERYIGTFQISEQGFVGHVFEVKIRRENSEQ